MAYEQLRRLVALEDNGNECLKECQKALESNDVTEAHQEAPGRITVRDALSTFRLRQNTTKAAGIWTCGFDETLQALGTRELNETLLLFSFASEMRVFSLFVTESEPTIVGCIRVMRK